MILLSFDIEEFDMPLEYDGKILLEEQLAVSRDGLQKILALLKKHDIKATFFSTVVFAENNQDLITELLSQGHELASHTCYHSYFIEEHLAESRQQLEGLFDTKVTGLRMPRMSPVSSKAVADAGYHYNSSLNPTWLPGRYNNLNVPKTYFYDQDILMMPASVSYFRFPLFWLSFHNLPLFLYQFLVKKSYSYGQYLNVYFHPWEFSNIKKESYKLPGFTTKDTGEAMVKKFDRFLTWLKKNHYSFGTFQQFQNQLGS